MLEQPKLGTSGILFFGMLYFIRRNVLCLQEYEKSGVFPFFHLRAESTKSHTGNGGFTHVENGSVHLYTSQFVRDIRTLEPFLDVRQDRHFSDKTERLGERILSQTRTLLYRSVRKKEPVKPQCSLAYVNIVQHPLPTEWRQRREFIPQRYRPCPLYFPRDTMVDCA